MSIRIASLVFVTLHLLVSSSLLAGVTGTLMNEEGQPIREANVSLFAPETLEARRARWLAVAPGRIPLSATRSDAAGTFAADPKREQIVDVFIEAEGYAPAILRLGRDEDAGAILLRHATRRSGTITAQSKPVAAARVIWAGDDGIEQTSITDARGRYEVIDPELWATGVTIVHPDHALFRSANRAGPVTLDAALTAGSSIEGSVVGTDGQPVSGAAILVDGFSWTKSLENGSFRLDHVGQGAEVSARANDAIGTLNGTVIHVAKGARLSGVIRGARVAGGEILLERLDVVVASTLTTTEGAYSLGPLEDGDYQIAVRIPGYSVAAETISVTPGRATEKHLTAVHTSTVIGEVTDFEKRPVAAAALLMEEVSPTGSSAFARTAPDGRFVMRQIDTESEFTLRVIKDGLPPASSPPIKLHRGTTKRGVLIEIDRGIDLAGRITDQDGHALAGAFVTAVPEGAGSDEIAITDRQGAFHLILQRGSHNVQVSANGFASQELAVRVDDVGPPLEIMMARASAISGSVRRSDGSAIVGVFVTAAADSTTETVITDVDGRFSLSNISAGDVVITASKPDEYINVRRAVSAPASNVVIEVGGSSTLSGRVVDKTTGRPVTRFEIELASATGSTTTKFAEGRTFDDERGEFEISNPPEGIVQIVVRAEGYAATKSDRLKMAAGQSIDDLEIELERPGAILGRVFDSAGTPIRGVEIEPVIVSALGDPLAAILPLGETESASDGSYAIASLAPGESTITFRKAGYEPQQRTVRIGDSVARLDVQLEVLGDGRGTETAPAPPVAASCSSRVMGYVTGISASEAAQARIVGHTGTAEVMTSIDANGAFSFDVSSGSLTLFAQLEAAAQSRSSRLVELDLPCHSAPMIELVFGDVVARGRVRHETQAVGDAVISFFPQDPLGPRGTTVVHADGSYSLSGLSAGRYLVAIRSERHVASYLASLTLEQGRDADIELVGARVTGRAIDRSTSLPIRGAMASIAPKSTPLARVTTVSGAGGEFAFDALPAGAYQLTIERDGDAAQASDLEIGPLEERHVDVVVN